MIPQLFADVIKNVVPDPEEQKSVAGDYAAAGSIQHDASQGLSPREILYNSLADQTSQVSKAKTNLLLAMNEDKPLSRSQTAAMLLISMLPIVAGGLLKGKEGLAKGAEAGALGATVYGKDLKDEQERERATDALAYKDLSDKQKTLQDEAFTTSRDEFKAADTAEQGDLNRQARIDAAVKGKTTVNVDNRQNQINEKIFKDSVADESFATSAQRVKKFMQQNFNTAEAIDSYEGLKKYGLRKFAEQNPNSKAAELKTLLEGLITEYQNSAIKGTPSDKDVARIEAVIEGKAAISTLPQLLTNVQNLRDSVIRHHNIGLRKSREFANDPKSIPDLTESQLDENLGGTGQDDSMDSMEYFRRMAEHLTGKKFNGIIVKPSGQ